MSASSLFYFRPLFFFFLYPLFWKQNTIFLNCINGKLLLDVYYVTGVRMRIAWSLF